MLRLFCGCRGKRRRRKSECCHLYGEALFGEIMERVEGLMREKKYYLNPHITLPHLVRVTGTNRTYLSRAIFWYCGTHFCDYVNGWRIREIISKVQDVPDDISLYEMAFSCGFNHRRTFYRAFVREIGIPPLDYMRRHEPEERDEECL